MKLLAGSSVSISGIAHCVRTLVTDFRKIKHLVVHWQLTAKQRVSRPAYFNTRQRTFCNLLIHEFSCCKCVHATSALRAVHLRSWCQASRKLGCTTFSLSRSSRSEIRLFVQLAVAAFVWLCCHHYHQCRVAADRWSSFITPAPKCGLSVLNILLSSPLSTPLVKC